MESQSCTKIRFEHILNNKFEKLENKIIALIKTWHSLCGHGSSPSKEDLITITEFLKSHTLNIVLSANWIKFKDKYHMVLVKAIRACTVEFDKFKGFILLCHKLAAIANNPWHKRTILHMLNNTQPVTTIDDYHFFVHEESGYFISMRLKKLCEDRCEDMALNLTRAYIKCCEWADAHNKSMYISEDQRKFVFDVYLALLFKLHITAEMSQLLKSVALHDAVDMVRRFACKLVTVSNIWLNSRRIAQLSATIFLTRAVMQPLNETSSFIQGLLQVWISTFRLHNKPELEDLINCLRKIIRHALSAPHMLFISRYLEQKVGNPLRNYNVEICIQALNTDLNLLEKSKTENENAVYCDGTTVRVADSFMYLATLLQDNLHVARECVMSAFSINPTLEYLHHLEICARASGHEVLDTGQWECKVHPPPPQDAELLITCNECKGYMSILKINPALQQPNFALAEALNADNMGLSTELQDDLVVILFCARYQMLSWLQNWPDLHRLCAMYLQDPVRTKNIITELKYVDIDYTPFMIKREYRQSSEDLTDVDHMYETDIEDLLQHQQRKRKRIQSTTEEDEDELENGSDSEDEDTMRFHKMQRSDPEVIKTLRSFRRTLQANIAAVAKPPTSQHSHVTHVEIHSTPPCTYDSPSNSSCSNTQYRSGVFIRTDIFENCNLNEPTQQGQINNTPFPDEPTTQTHAEDLSSRAVRELPVYKSTEDLLYAEADAAKEPSICSALEHLSDGNISDPSVLSSQSPVVSSVDKNLANDPTVCKNLTVVLSPLTSPFISNSPTESESTIPANDDNNVVPLDEANASLEVLSSDSSDVASNKDETSTINLLSNDGFSTTKEVNCIQDDLEASESIHKHVEAWSSLDLGSDSSDPTVCSKDFSDRENEVSSVTEYTNDYKADESTSGAITDDDETFNVNSCVNSDESSQSYIFKDIKCTVEVEKMRHSVLLKYLGARERQLTKRDVLKPIPLLRRSKQAASVMENKVQSKRATNKDENYNINLLKSRAVLSPNNSAVTLEALKKKMLTNGDSMNPRVVLKRLEDSRVESLLAGVPGISDTNLFRPDNTDRIINVVQVAGGRPTSTVSAPNTQTSTQVSPHIQRIGQPRSEKTEPETTSKSGANSYTISKPVATQSPTLINILSQQITRPSQSGNTRTRTGPVINILSQQTIKSPTTTAVTTKSTTVTSDVQGSNAPRIVATSTEQPQILNQIVNPGRPSGPIKTVVDGKLIPVTSFPSNRLVKVASQAQDSPGNVEESTKKTDELSESLPKFQQAFGKSVYQNSVDTCTNLTNDDKNKPKNNAVNMQPIQGGVIYTRQMPINLLPQTRGQVFRIATTNADLVKDTVIHSKMSALLAAALQSKPKTTESSTTTVDEGAAAARLQLTRPTLVQNARIVKPVLQIPSNVIRNTPQTNLSSTTLEQLREFDMVYKQVKERSSTSAPAEAIAAASESNDASPQRISVTYLNQGQKIGATPVVVVSSFGSLQPAASPALSVVSQGSNSPCVTPAPSTPVLTKVAVKGSKGKTVKPASAPVVPTSPMHASKTSPIPKPQQKPQEDEHTTQRIFDILAEYAEQLRNSPDLNNKPAPRRRSNPPTNPSQNSKRKKSSSKKSSGQSSSIVTEADVDDPRTVGSEDSSCGVVQLSVQEDDQIPVASTSESNDSSAPTTPRQQLILTDSSHNQTRNLIIADSSVGEALKIPNTAVLVPGNYIMPVSMVKGGQQIAVVSGGSKILATVPARSGPNMLLFQSFLNQNRKSSVPTVKYSTISGVPPQSQPVILPPPPHGIGTVTLGQPIAIKKLDETDRSELLLTISQSSSEESPQPDSSTGMVKAEGETDESNTAMSNYPKPLNAGPIATSVIAQNIKEEIIVQEQSGPVPTQTIMTLNISTLDGKAEKPEERVQSVLVTAGSSNGPMLSHSPPQYKQSDCGSASDKTKDDFLRNSAKRNDKVPQVKVKKAVGAARLDREVQQICMQRRQAALERELRLQKSLSEECEDLGVDEPSTSDLFPEALLFDANNSPSSSFDHASEMKRGVSAGLPTNTAQPTVAPSAEKEAKLTLFDEDFMFEPSHCYEEVVLTNGQSSCVAEDNTLLQTCTSMSDVTLSSPISPEGFHASSPPLNKYMHKYTNKKRHDRMRQPDGWAPPADISSSEDTTGSNELGKGESECENDEAGDAEGGEAHFKDARLPGPGECNELHCVADDESDPASGRRGARKSVKKQCSCCNGTDDGARKRPAAHQLIAIPHKKAFPNRKR